MPFTTAYFYSVGSPRVDDLNAVPRSESLGIIWQEQTRSDRNTLQVKTITELVAYQHGIPFLKLLKKRPVDGGESSLTGSKKP